MHVSDTADGTFHFRLIHVDHYHDKGEPLASRCPGVHFADSSIFIWCAMILSVYDISKAVGPDGEIVEPTCEYSTGIIRYVW